MGTRRLLPIDPSISLKNGSRMALFFLARPINWSTADSILFLFLFFFFFFSTKLKKPSFLDSCDSCCVMVNLIFQKEKIIWIYNYWRILMIEWIEKYSFFLNIEKIDYDLLEIFNVNILETRIEVIYYSLSRFI